MTNGIAKFVLVLLLVFLPCAAVLAQPVVPAPVPVTGWYDGDPTASDGVPHGTGSPLGAFKGAGLIWDPWIRPYPQAWQSILTFKPKPDNDTYGCLIDPNTGERTQGFGSLGSNVSSVIPLDDPDGHTSLYFFGSSAFDGNPPDRARFGTLRDEIGVTVRYWNSTYDTQPFLMFLPNEFFNDCPFDPILVCNQYAWGNGPFGSVIRGPETGPSPHLYMFFGAERTDVTFGRGDHLIGVSNPAVNFVRTAGGLWEACMTGFQSPNASGSVPPECGPAGTSPFLDHRWLDTSSANHTGLNALKFHHTSPTGHPFDLGILDRYDPKTEAISNGTFTPILARVARRRKEGCNTFQVDVQKTDGCQVNPFTEMTGIYKDGYFYLFVGLNTPRTLSFRIPYDAAQSNGLRRRTDTGAVDVELWYMDEANPQGAYHQIDSSKPVTFSDTDEQGHDNMGDIKCSQLSSEVPCGPPNPNVPIENAYLRGDSGDFGSPLLYYPAGMTFYQANGTYWMESGGFPQAGTKTMVHRLVYDATNPSNPWSISTPFTIQYEGESCPACTVFGNNHLPSKYTNNYTAVVYPSSRKYGVAVLDVNVPTAYCTDLRTAQCLARQAAVCPEGQTLFYVQGLLPFTIGDSNPNSTANTVIDFETGGGCTYTVSPAQWVDVDRHGATQTFTVTTQPNCQWKAGPQAHPPATSFATAPAGTFTGSQSVTVTVSANFSGRTRSGYVSIAGRQISVTQQQGGRGHAVGFTATAPSTTVSGSPMSVTVVALDENGAVIDDYIGSVWFSSSDTAANLPGTYQYSAADQGQHSFPVTMNTVGTKTVTSTEQGSTSSGTATTNVASSSLPAPSSCDALFLDSSVRVSWPQVAGATSYEVYRYTRRGVPSQTPIITTPYLSLLDTSIAAGPPRPGTAGTTYVYSIVAVDANGVKSARSPEDYAATFVFTMDSATPPRILGSDFSDLRFAVDSVRAAAGLNPAFTSYAPLTGFINHGDIGGIRTALNEARAQFGFGSWGYTYSAAANTIIHLVDVTQVQDGVK